MKKPIPVKIVQQKKLSTPSIGQKVTSICAEVVGVAGAALIAVEGFMSQFVDRDLTTGFAYYLLSVVFLILTRAISFKVKYSKN